MSVQYNIILTLPNANLIMHVSRPAFVTLAQQNSGRDSGTAVAFKVVLEMVSLAMLATSLVVALFMEFRIIRSVYLQYWNANNG